MQLNVCLVCRRQPLDALLYMLKIISPHFPVKYIHVFMLVQFIIQFDSQYSCFRVPIIVSVYSFPMNLLVCLLVCRLVGWLVGRLTVCHDLLKRARNCTCFYRITCYRTIYIQTYTSLSKTCKTCFYGPLCMSVHWLVGHRM